MRKPDWIRNIFYICWITCCFTLFSSLCYSQFQPDFIHYTREDGLSANEIYAVHQDHKGYIWFAHENGISRFDGYQFRNYTSEDGLTENMITKIYEGLDQQLWFGSLKGHLFSFDRDQDKIIPYVYNHIIDKQSKSTVTNVLYAFNFDKEGTLNFSMSGLFLQISSTGKFSSRESSTWGIARSSDEKETKRDLFFYLVDEDQFQYPLWSGIPGDFEDTCEIQIYQKNKIHTWEKADASQEKYWKFDFNYKLHGCLMRKNGQGYLFKYQTYNCFFNGDSLFPVSSTLKGEGIGSYLDKKERLWLGLTRKGALLFQSTDTLLEHGQSFLDGYSVSGILEDRSGGFWFTTLESGIFYAPDLHFEMLSFHPDNNVAVKKLTRSKDKLYFTTSENDIFEIDQKEKLKQIDLSPHKDKINVVRNIFYDTIHDELIANAALLPNNRIYYDRHKSHSKAQDHFLHCFYFKGGKLSPYLQTTAAPDGTTWSYDFRGFSNWNGDDLQYASFDQYRRSMRHSSITVDNENRLWLTSNKKGIFVFDEDTLIDMSTKDSLLNLSSHSITTIDDYIAFGTQSHGIVFYDLKKEHVFNIGTEEGIKGNHFTAIENGENGIWVASFDGLNYIVSDTAGYRLKTVYTKANHPTLSSINDLEIIDDKVWCATDNGLIRFNPERLNGKKKNTTPICITRVAINSSDTSLSGEYNLNYKQNYFNISFINFNYRLNGDITYRYKIEGLQNEWQITKSNQVALPKVAPGEYIFNVQAQDENGTWTQQTASFKFNIRPPFWQQTWFTVLIILLIILIITSVFYIRVRILKKRHDLQEALLKSRLKAMGQQMNPHFIFNALNSIQSYMLSHDKVNSHQYLGKFSKLMRANLEHTQEQFITLEEEIKILQLYMDIEALRFENDFDFEMIIDEDIYTTHTLIPPFLIQPFLENALWHGMAYKKKNGKIELTFSLKGKNIHCEVTDNGIGRKAAMEQKQGNKHKSLGLRITENRLKMIQELYGGELTIRYSDLYNGDTPEGTKVSITIPFLKKKFSSNEDTDY